MAGVTLYGFEKKRLVDIKAEIENALKTNISPSLNLSPETVLGQLVGIFAERESLLWELAEYVYNSQYPMFAEGVNLDNVVSITGTVRKGASKSKVTEQIFFGSVGTVIPKGSIVSVAGNSAARFLTDAEVTIEAGQDEKQKILFSSVPDAGSWSLKFRGESTSLLAFNASNSDIQNALNNLSKLSEVTVTGDYSSGIIITFGGLDGKRDQPLLEQATNTLTASSNPVTITISELIKGAAQAKCSMTAEIEGDIDAPAETLTEIESPISGWTRTLNLEDAIVGSNEESDDELKNRRIKELGRAGAATLEAIVADLFELDGVTAIVVFENNSSIIDSEGRPPHSIDIVVENGDEDDIAEAIYNTVAAGIETIGSISKTVIDSMGFSHIIRFSRPTPVPIYIELDLVTDPEFFPVNGIDQVKNAIYEYGKKLKMGQDIIVFGTDPLTSSFKDVAGILDYTIRIGKTPSPTSDNNIVIAPRERANIDTSRISVNVV